METNHQSSIKAVIKFAESTQRFHPKALVELEGDGKRQQTVLRRSSSQKLLLGPTQLRSMIAKRNVFQKAYLDRWTTITSANKDYPGSSFPVTFADRNLDKKRSNWTPLSHTEANIQACYDPEFYQGAPVRLPCVGCRFDAEKVLELVWIITDAQRPKVEA
ncbi:hypothetical protein V502_00267 [Pseudogymnoascus sp. VKM F-4520 (FW-2644)]|nr:hypothetical protein V502_00267 [Pseudogymnoascus sp. VKM F-4520 (FW-2644)]